MTTSWNALATLSLCLADASVNAQPNLAARASPSSRLTVLLISQGKRRKGGGKQRLALDINTYVDN